MTKTLEPPIDFATLADVTQLARLFAESLFDDPLQRWLFPDEARRLTTSERMFRRLLKFKIKQDLVRVIRADANQVVSAAVWTPPHPPAPTHWERYCDSLFMRWTYGRRVHEIRRGSAALAARHPPQPYWYLQALMTAPNERGKGLAKALLAEKLCECAAGGVLVALETSNSANAAYYERFGFQIVDELELTESLPVWLMCRSPQASMV